MTRIFLFNLEDMGKKMYFATPDDDRCYGRDHFDWIMEETGEEAVKVYPAVRDLESPGFFCRHFREVGERGDSCRGCNEYTPRNGRNGICLHWRHCYRADLENAVILKRKK